MHQTNVANLKSHLSRYLAIVRGGGEVVVAERNRPVARLVAYGGAKGEESGWAARLAELERLGQVRAAVRTGRHVPVVPVATSSKGGAGAVEVLIEERRGGR
jgi:prevent-host-death family protein